MPLIPAQIVAELMDQQQQAQQPTQVSPHALASIFNPAMQMQLAQHLRHQSLSGGGLRQTGAPLADHVRQAKAAAQLAPPQAQPAPAGAGTMSIQSHPQMGQTGHMPISPQAADQQAWLRTILGKETGQMPQVTENKGGTTITDLNQMPTNRLAAGMQRNAAHLAPGESIQPVAGGYQISGAGAPAQANPVADMLGSFKGHVPDHILAAAQNAIAAGMPVQQVFGHLQTAAQQKQPAAKDNTDRERTTMLQAKLHHLEHEEDHALEQGQNPADYEKQIQDTIGQLGPQQTPTPPRVGHPLDAQNAQHFLQMAGGDKAKARELAKQAGWSF